ncbi:Dysferlin [Porphyridium purpureum]|uniref:Dysferlin n=1 Tax=Porphyridium purpureum TaxID=35688 RepID=A0A5J4YPY6_PORPP|nr:Dysferlin [Porphyridium purpureum]|eukprot:POR3722..scf222_8
MEQSDDAYRVSETHTAAIAQRDWDVPEADGGQDWTENSSDDWKKQRQGLGLPLRVRRTAHEFVIEDETQHADERVTAEQQEDWEDQFSYSALQAEDSAGHGATRHRHAALDRSSFAFESVPTHLDRGAQNGRDDADADDNGDFISPSLEPDEAENYAMSVALQYTDRFSSSGRTSQAPSPSRLASVSFSASGGSAHQAERDDSRPHDDLSPWEWIRAMLPSTGKYPSGPNDHGATYHAVASEPPSSQVFGYRTSAPEASMLSQIFFRRNTQSSDVSFMNPSEVRDARIRALNIDAPDMVPTDAQLLVNYMNQSRPVEGLLNVLRNAKNRLDDIGRAMMTHRGNGQPVQDFYDVGSKLERFLFGRLVREYGSENPVEMQLQEAAVVDEEEEQLQILRTQLQDMNTDLFRARKSSLVSPWNSSWSLVLLPALPLATMYTWMVLSYVYPIFLSFVVTFGVRTLSLIVLAFFALLLNYLDDVRQITWLKTRILEIEYKVVLISNYFGEAILRNFTPEMAQNVRARMFRVRDRILHLNGKLHRTFGFSLVGVWVYLFKGFVRYRDIHNVLWSSHHGSIDSAELQEDDGNGTSGALASSFPSMRRRPSVKGDFEAFKTIAVEIQLLRIYDLILTDIVNSIWVEVEIQDETVSRSDVFDLPLYFDAQKRSLSIEWSAKLVFNVALRPRSRHKKEMEKKTAMAGTGIQTGESTRDSERRGSIGAPDMLSMFDDKRIRMRIMGILGIPLYSPDGAKRYPSMEACIQASKRALMRLKYAMGRRVPEYTDEPLELAWCDLSGKALGGGLLQKDRIEHQELRIPFKPVHAREFVLPQNTACAVLDCNISLATLPDVSLSYALRSSELKGCDWKVAMHIFEIRGIDIPATHSVHSPYVELRAFDRTRYSSVVSRSSTFVLGETLQLNGLCTGRELEKQAVTLRLWASRLGFNDLLMGELTFKASAIYALASHTLYSAWFPFMADGYRRISGFVRLSVCVVPADVKVPRALTDPGPENDPVLLQDAIVTLPSSRVYRNTVQVSVGFADFLPYMVKSEGQFAPDIVRCYAELEYPGHGKVVSNIYPGKMMRIEDPNLNGCATIRVQRKADMNLEFSLSVLWPRTAQEWNRFHGLIFRLWHRNDVISERQKLICEIPLDASLFLRGRCTAYVRTKPSEGEGTLHANATADLPGDRIAPYVSMQRPRYFHMYGNVEGPINLDATPYEYRGRVLMSLSAREDYSLVPMSVREVLRAPLPRPPISRYRFRLSIVRATEIPVPDGFEISVKCSFGPYEFGHSIPDQKVSGAQVTWPQHESVIDADFLQFPEDILQIPDLFITLLTLPKIRYTEYSRREYLDGLSRGKIRKSYAGDPARRHIINDRTALVPVTEDRQWRRLSFIRLTAHYVLCSPFISRWMYMDFPGTTDLHSEKVPGSLLFAIELCSSKSENEGGTSDVSSVRDSTAFRDDSTRSAVGSHPGMDSDGRELGPSASQLNMDGAKLSLRGQHQGFAGDTSPPQGHPSSSMASFNGARSKAWSHVPAKLYQSRADGIEIAHSASEAAKQASTASEGATISSGDTRFPAACAEVVFSTAAHAAKDVISSAARAVRLSKQEPAPVSIPAASSSDKTHAAEPVTLPSSRWNSNGQSLARPFTTLATPEAHSYGGVAERHRMNLSDRQSRSGATGSAATTMRRTIRGDLLAFIIRGKNIPAADASGLSDPFVVLSIGNRRQKGKVVCWQTVAPVWKEIMLIENVEWLEGESRPNLNIILYDWNETKVQYLGRAIINAENLDERPPSVETAKWHSVFTTNPVYPVGEILADFQLIQKSGPGSGHREDLSALFTTRIVAPTFSSSSKSGRELPIRHEPTVAATLSLDLLPKMVTRTIMVTFVGLEKVRLLRKPHGRFFVDVSLSPKEELRPLYTLRSRFGKITQTDEYVGSCALIDCLVLRAQFPAELAHSDLFPSVNLFVYVQFDYRHEPELVGTRTVLVSELLQEGRASVRTAEDVSHTLRLWSRVSIERDREPLLRLLECGVTLKPSVMEQLEPFLCSSLRESNIRVKSSNRGWSRKDVWIRRSPSADATALSKTKRKAAMKGYGLFGRFEPLFIFHEAVRSRVGKIREALWRFWRHILTSVSQVMPDAAELVGLTVLNMYTSAQEADYAGFSSPGAMGDADEDESVGEEDDDDERSGKAGEKAGKRREFSEESETRWDDTSILRKKHGYIPEEIESVAGFIRVFTKVGIRRGDNRRPAEELVHMTAEQRNEILKERRVLGEPSQVQIEVDHLIRAGRTPDYGSVSLRVDVFQDVDGHDMDEMRRLRSVSLRALGTWFQPRSVMCRLYLLVGRNLLRRHATCNSYANVYFHGGTPRMYTSRRTPVYKSFDPAFFVMFQSLIAMPGGSVDIEIRNKVDPQVSIPVRFPWYIREHGAAGAAGLGFISNELDINFGQIGLGWDETIGVCQVSLNDRWYNPCWRAMQCVPVETRLLLSEKSPHAQGRVDIMLEMMDAEEYEKAPRLYPPVQLSIPPRRNFMLRCVVFDISEVHLPFMLSDDVNKFANFFVHLRLGNEPSEARRTDICKYSTDGSAQFNWRVGWKIQLPDLVLKPRLKLQVYETGPRLGGESRLCCVADIRLRGLFQEALQISESESVVRVRQKVLMKHPSYPEVLAYAQVSLEIIPEGQAALKRCNYGEAGREFNQHEDYILPPPFRPAPFSIVNPSPYFSYSFRKILVWANEELVTVSLLVPLILLGIQLLWYTPWQWYLISGIIGLVLFLRVAYLQRKRRRVIFDGVRARAVEKQRARDDQARDQEKIFKGVSWVGKAI